MAIVAGAAIRYSLFAIRHSLFTTLCSPLRHAGPAQAFEVALAIHVVSKWIDLAVAPHSEVRLQRQQLLDVRSRFFAAPEVPERGDQRLIGGAVVGIGL